MIKNSTSWTVDRGKFGVERRKYWIDRAKEAEKTINKSSEEKKE